MSTKSLHQKVMQSKPTTAAQHAPGGSGPEGVSIGPNHTGLPDALKSGIEARSGMSLDDVRVHNNSPKPAQLQALAYTQGTDIHVAPGQERHIPHEAWHVVQKKQERVRPTSQAAGAATNDDQSLEREADRMGSKSLRGNAPVGNLHNKTMSQAGYQMPVQRISIRKTGANVSRSVTDIDGLATLVNLPKATVLKKVSDNVYYMHFDENFFNEFLRESYDEAEGNDKNQVLARLSILYMNYISDKREAFAKTVGSIANNTANATNRKYHTLHPLYTSSGTDDGMSVTDDWNKALACSLYALLLLRPKFMGARSPEELHTIFRSSDSTKDYDDDLTVGKIRLAAGLNFSTDFAGQTVNQLIESLGPGDTNRKIIVDPHGEAHTFTLIHDGGQWKRFDNDAPNGSTTIKYGANKIIVTWE